MYNPKKISAKSASSFVGVFPEKWLKNSRQSDGLQNNSRSINEILNKKTPTLGMHQKFNYCTWRIIPGRTQVVNHPG